MSSSTPARSIALIGPYPPPYGGISVHIQRLYRRLALAGYATRVYCQPLDQRIDGIFPLPRHLSWERWLLHWAWRSQPKIIHCHHGFPWSPAMALMLARGKRVVMTFHTQNVGLGLDTSPALCRFFARWILGSTRVEWIAVSAAVRDQLRALGVSPERVHVIPAFLPPLEHSDTRALPDALDQFIAAHRPVLVTYGWRVSFDPDGHDLYGFDLCIELARALKPEFPGIGLVILLPQIGDTNYWNELQRRVREFGLQTHILFWTEPLDEPHHLWARADVFVRATTTDGDAVSVREALSMRVPVVASDASPRPDGVVLTPTRNLDALVANVRTVLMNRAQCVEKLGALEMPDNFDAVLDVYKKMLTQELSA